MDVIPESIEDAKKNAARHGIKHAKYVTGKAEVLLPKWTKEGWTPDVVIVDPPRTGLDGQLLNTILKVEPKKWFMYHVIPLPWRRIFRYCQKNIK